MPAVTARHTLHCRSVPAPRGLGRWDSCRVPRYWVSQRPRAWGIGTLGQLWSGSGDLGGQLADLLDPNLHGIAGLKEFAAGGADAGRCAGEDQVAGMQRHTVRQLRDLLGQVEDHVLAVGILLEHVVDPELEAEILRVADLARRHDPGSERARAVEGLVLGPVSLERRGIANVRPRSTVARGKIVGGGVAGDVAQRLVLGDVLGWPADH